MTSQHTHFVFQPTQPFVELQSEGFAHTSSFYNVAPEIKAMENMPMPSFPGDFVSHGYDGYSNVPSNLLPFPIHDDELLITPNPPTLGPLPSSEHGINPVVLSRNSSTSPSSVYHTPLEDPLSSIDLSQFMASHVGTQGNQTMISPQDLIPMPSGDVLSLHALPSQTTISPNALLNSNHLASSGSFHVAPTVLHPSHPLPSSRAPSPATSFRTAPVTLSRPGSAYSARSVRSFHSQRPSLQVSASFASHSVVEPGHSTFPAVNLSPLVIADHARVPAPTVVSPTPQRINAASASSFAFPPQSDANVNAVATLLSSMGPYQGMIDSAAIVSPRIARHTRIGSAPTSASYSPMHSSILAAADNGLPAHDSLILAGQSPIAYPHSMLFSDALRTGRRSVSPTARSPYHQSEIEESGSSAGSPFTQFGHTRNPSIVSTSFPANYFPNAFNSVESASSSQQLPAGGIDPSLLSAHSGGAMASASTRHSTPRTELPQYPARQSEVVEPYWPIAPVPQTTSKRLAAPRKTKRQPVESRPLSGEYTDDEYFNGQDTDDDYDGEDKKRKRGKSAASGANKRQKTTMSEDQYDSESAQISKMKYKSYTLPKLTPDMRSCPVCHFVPANKRYSDVQRHYQSHFKEGAKDKQIYVCTLCGDVEHDPVTMQRVYNNRPGHPKSVTTVYTRKDSVKRHWNSYHKPTDANWQEDYITTVDAVHPDAAGAKKKSAKQEVEVDDSFVSFPLSI